MTIKIITKYLKNTMKLIFSPLMNQKKMEIVTMKIIKGKAIGVILQH